MLRNVVNDRVGLLLKCTASKSKVNSLIDCTEEECVNNNIIIRPAACPNHDNNKVDGKVYI